MGFLMTARRYRVWSLLVFSLPVFIAGCGALPSQSKVPESKTAEAPSSTAGEGGASKSDTPTPPPTASESPAPSQPPPTVPASAAPSTEAKPETHAHDEAVPPAQPAQPAGASTSAVPVPQKRGPNNFVVTAGPKTPQHPYYGRGHSLGLFVNGAPGKTLVLRRGETYEFDVATDAKHDVYFSTSPMGWGGAAVTDGVKGQFTYRGTITVTPNAATPDVIYYQCRNHNSMGGKVVVVSATATKAEIDKLLAAPDASATGETQFSASGGVAKEIPVDAARQKIMLAEMMLQSKSAKSVAEGADGSGKANIAQATKKIQAARSEVDAGRNTAALKLAEEALGLITAATQSLTKVDQQLQLKGRYAEVQEALHNFQESHKQSYARTLKKRGQSAVVDYDHAKVDALTNEARGFADKGQYDKAIQSLSKAERLVTQAIQSMLDSQTIVYDLNFETPAEEYDYELKRYIGYEELIPVAIEEKKPAESVVKLMDTYVEKGKAQKAEAERRAKAGNYPDAISLMLSATEEIRRALRLAGVSQ